MSKTGPLLIDSSEDSSEEGGPSTDGDSCKVCGQSPAQMHYGAMACVGCKGFFRRALKKIDQLECLGSGTCQITKDARTNCRSCRLRACLDAGMNPAAVRPDRDFTGRQRKTKKTPVRVNVHQNPERIPSTSEEWGKRLSVEMRTMLMTLLNFEAKISRGDTTEELLRLYPLKARTLRELLEDPTLLKGKRSAMRYENDRLIGNGELSPIAYRRLIAAIDWVEYLSELLPTKLSIEDRIALVKGCFLPLLVFKVAARTAVNTKTRDVLCMCNCSYLPRDVGKLYNDCYHWNNGLVDRVLEELVEPYRRLGLTEEEIVCLSSIVVLNPLYKDLSEKASDMLLDLRNKIQECLFAIVRETRPGQSSVQYGNILLSLPTVWTMANEMCENLVFAQTFSTQPQITLISNLFGCFPVEPFEEEKATEEVQSLRISSIPQSLPTATSTSNHPNQMASKSVQMTDRAVQTDHPLAVRKRRLPDTCKSPVESEPRKMPFSLREAPTDFTLAEMFDDLEQEAGTAGPSTSQANLNEESGSRSRAASQPSHLKDNEKLRSNSFLTLSSAESSSSLRSQDWQEGYGRSQRGFYGDGGIGRGNPLYRTASHPNAPLLLYNHLMTQGSPSNETRAFVGWDGVAETHPDRFKKPPLQPFLSHPQYPL